jgi:hypothetical protein
VLLLLLLLPPTKSPLLAGSGFDGRKTGGIKTFALGCGSTSQDGSPLDDDDDIMAAPFTGE